jgi:hypothetical protein
MLNSDRNQLIADVARDIVTQIAPQELPLFRATSTAYFKDSNKLSKRQAGRDEMLGFGIRETVPLLTPTVLFVMTGVVTFVTGAVKDPLVECDVNLINHRAKKMFKKFRFEGKNETNNPSPLTLQQIAHVRKLAYERFLQLKLYGAQANTLTDAVVATLVTEAS